MFLKMPWNYGDMKIIQSILDLDSYKLSMSNAILDCFPNAQAKYRFINRGPQRFNEEFLRKLIHYVDGMDRLSLNITEKEWLRKICLYLKPAYLEYLANYRYDPSQVKMKLTSDGNLDLTVSGTWHSATMWETTLMAIISELYFTTIDTKWSMIGQKEKFEEKFIKLMRCIFSEFGTRRRRNFEVQDLAVKTFKNLMGVYPNASFVGTSNVHLSRIHNLIPRGTFAHEWVQGNSALESLNHANYYAMHNWAKVFNMQLGTALTDTYGTDAFLKNFNTRFAHSFTSVRHDSGDPFIFTDKIVGHYKKLGINPGTKSIIFSDGLNCEKCIDIQKYCHECGIGCSFGIGTHFTNDFEDSQALNMVIKLVEIDGFPVVKLSDDAGKETGDPKALEVVKWIYGR